MSVHLIGHGHGQGHGHGWSVTYTSVLKTDTEAA
jgi:hypothetical protein